MRKQSWPMETVGVAKLHIENTSEYVHKHLQIVFFYISGNLKKKE